MGSWQRGLRARWFWSVLGPRAGAAITPSAPPLRQLGQLYLPPISGLFLPRVKFHRLRGGLGYGLFSLREQAKHSLWGSRQCQRHSHHCLLRPHMEGGQPHCGANSGALGPACGLSLQAFGVWLGPPEQPDRANVAFVLSHQKMPGKACGADELGLGAHHPLFHQNCQPPCSHSRKLELPLQVPIQASLHG